MNNKALGDYTKEELIGMVNSLKRQKKFGLVWEDKPEQVAIDCEKKLPVLKEVPERVIDKAKDDSPTNIIIEGDNYHALSILNYTHAGKINVIYIDPPYNTGNKDFIYNDRFIDKEDTYRHSKWLSFMEKRLKLAKSLLNKTGVIFISIDDNEQSHLKLLCDQIFGTENFISQFKWNRVAKAPSLSMSVRTKYEYVLVYSKNKNLMPKLFGKSSYNSQAPLWHLPNKRQELLFPAGSIKTKQNFKARNYGGTYNVELLDDIIELDGRSNGPVRIKAHSSWGQAKINAYILSGQTFEIKKSPTTFYTTLQSKGNFIAPSDLIRKDECGVETNTDASEAIKKMGLPFDFPKPVSLVKYLANMVVHDDRSAIILDFFAGSGTTGHAVMELNKEDGGHRQFILCTNNENKIAGKVTYPRIQKVIDGYGSGGKKVDGIPANVRYFKTGFIEKDETLDKLRRELAPACEDMIRIREGAYEEVLDDDMLKVYRNKRGMTAIIYDRFELEKYIKQIEELETDSPVHLYVFSYGKDDRSDEMPDGLKHSYENQPIPEGVLEIYKRIFDKKGGKK